MTLRVQPTKLSPFRECSVFWISAIPSLMSKYSSSAKTSRSLDRISLGSDGSLDLRTLVPPLTSAPQCICAICSSRTISFSRCIRPSRAIHLSSSVHWGNVRYPTCLRTEFDLKANTISAQHPNSDTRIKIAHGFTDNLTISSPYEPRPSRTTGFSFLSISSPYSRRDPRWFPGYDLLI